MKYEIIIDPATGRVVKKVIGGVGPSCHGGGDKLRESVARTGEEQTKAGHLPEFHQTEKAKPRISAGQ